MNIQIDTICFIYFLLQNSLFFLHRTSSPIFFLGLHARGCCSTLSTTTSCGNGYIGQTNRKRNESALLIWATRRRPFICSGWSRGLLSIMRHRYLCTAPGDTVKKVVEFFAESIKSLSNLVRSIQIRRRILLKLQISEQSIHFPFGTWKPEKHCSINTNLHHSPWI